MRPEHFVSLQDLGFECINYYFGKGGQEIGLTREELDSSGITDETLWVHSDVISPLTKAKSIINNHGMGIAIKDAWRPKKLYEEIVKHRRAKGVPVEELINIESMPHATGKAVDVVLTDLETGKVIWTRNQERDGIECCFVDFYRNKHDAESIKYQNLQSLLLNAFLANGFVLGPRRESWHFQLPDTMESERF